MSNWDTPPGGDFARYVEDLSRQSTEHQAHREMTSPGSVDRARPAPPSVPAPAPGSVGAKNAAAVEKARRAAAARQTQGAAASPPFVPNASAPRVVQPADLWKAVRPPIFGYIALQIAGAFFPVVDKFTTLAFFFFVAWAVYRVVKMVGGSEAWQKAGRHIAEELKKQQQKKG